MEPGFFYLNMRSCWVFLRDESGEIACPGTILRELFMFSQVAYFDAQGEQVIRFIPKAFISICE